MTRRRMLTGAGVGVVLAVVVAGAVLLPRGGGARASAEQTAAPTIATVERGPLSASVSQAGTLTYRASPDGSPYPVVNQASGTYTALPDGGGTIRCGDVLYRVDDAPVLLLCGTLPAYRDLHPGNRGGDVRQLNRTLHELGYPVAEGDTFTTATTTALGRLQHDRGQQATGSLPLADAVFLPGPLRIAKVSGQLGGPARPGTEVAQATSDTLHVTVEVDPSQQGQVKRGDRVQITLPGSVPATGRVDGFGPIAQTTAAAGTPAPDASVPTSIALDDPAAAQGLDRAPVQVDITTEGVADALSVPVTALVGKAGGGFGVEVVRPDGRRDLVAVEPGLFDTGGGRVQVEGALHEGDAVVVPTP